MRPWSLWSNLGVLRFAEMPFYTVFSNFGLSEKLKKATRALLTRSIVFVILGRFCLNGLGFGRFRLRWGGPSGHLTSPNLSFSCFLGFVFLGGFYFPFCLSFVFWKSQKGHFLTMLEFVSSPLEKHFLQIRLFFLFFFSFSSLSRLHLFSVFFINPFWENILVFLLNFSPCLSSSLFLSSSNKLPWNTPFSNPNCFHLFACFVLLCFFASFGC